ncbi:MAG: MATE family efflux transporter [Bacteroidota bacterium]|nr:MATE family efflux transporter [Bacteroidota bacterium]
MLTSKQHYKETINLAWPLILTQVGHIVTGMVDTIFLGQIGVAEQAAGIFANNISMLLLVFGIGLSYATTPLVTNAHENNDLEQKASLFKNSLFLNLSTSFVLFLILFFSVPLLKHLQQPPEVVEMATPFFEVIIFSMIPTTLFFVCKQYCEGLSNTSAGLIISVLGNILNIVLNYLLINGYMGLPKMGYMGSAWATFIARCFMGIAFLYLMYKTPALNAIFTVYKKVNVNMKHLGELAKIGFNSAMQFTFEVAAFVIAGLMAGSFGKEQIDAHGIALHIAAFTYMFGSGIGSAATIRIGIFNAQNNWQEVKNAGLTAIKLVLMVMGGCGLIFLALHQYLPSIFSSEKAVIELASQLLLIAALFQLFDGLQVTVIGILRGIEDVRISTLITFIGYWVIALSLCYLLAFTFKMEVIGIWIGLLVSLVFVGLALFWRFKYLYTKNLGKSI